MKALRDHLASDELKQIRSLKHGEDFLLLEFDHAHDKFNKDVLTVEHEDFEDAHGLGNREVVHEKGDENGGKSCRNS